jgi:hypothetical protein
VAVIRLRLYACEPQCESALMGLTSKDIADLRARHVAFLAERLVDDRAHGDFIRSFAAGYEHVLSLPLKQVVEPKILLDGIRGLLTNATVRGAFVPIGREINRRVIAALKSESTKLGDYVPAEARDAINELLARKDLLSEELIHKIFEDEVVEEIMRDVIYDALKEFNDSVNPFFADWGLPALIKRFMPIGSGPVLKSMTAVRAEFDKRLEPEMRKFLLGFSRKSKKKLATFLVSSAGDPKQIALRQSIVAFFYEETLAQITKNVDDDARMNADEAAEAIVLEVLRRERPHERLLIELEELIKEHGDASIGEFLARIGVTQRPDLEKLAELLWPFVRLALESPPARAFYERVIWDFYATLTADGEGTSTSSSTSA